MEKILALDYGLKRTGIAYAESPLFIAYPLSTVYTQNLIHFLMEYISENTVKKIIVGEPKSLDGRSTDVTNSVNELKIKLNNTFPRVKIILYDERFTSKIAMQSMIQSGVRKHKRRNKENIDKVSATVILQGYLQKNRV